MRVKSRRRMAFLWKINRQCILKTCFNHPQVLLLQTRRTSLHNWCDDQRLEMTTWSLHQGNCFSIRNDLRAKEKSWSERYVFEMVQQHQHSKTVRIIINKSRILDCALFCCKARRKRLEHERSLGRDTRCSALAAFCVLYNRTEHSQVFSVCFMIKNLINSSRITLNLTWSCLMTLSF